MPEKRKEISDTYLERRGRKDFLCGFPTAQVAKFRC
jgi:hypothetical protein